MRQAESPNSDLNTSTDNAVEGSVEQCRYLRSERANEAGGDDEVGGGENAKLLGSHQRLSLSRRWLGGGQTACTSASSAAGVAIDYAL